MHKDLISWVARNQEFYQRKYFFQKFLISFGLFFDENNIEKLFIDQVICEGIAATYGQLLLK